MQTSANINVTDNITSIAKHEAVNINDTSNNNNTIKKDNNKMINRGTDIFILNDTEFKSAAERKDPRSIFDLQNLDNKNQSNNSDQEADQTNSKELSSITPTDTTSTIDTSTYYPELKTDVTKVDTTTEATTNTDYSTAKTLSSDFNTLSLPPWKKYTIIDRKRTSTEDTTASTKEMAVAETAQISLDEVLNNTFIPSLEKLKNDLLNSQESTTSKLETSSATGTTNVNITESSETPTSSMIVTTETGNTKLELVSKRAGYKDNRETTMTQLYEATTSELPPTLSKNNTEMFSSMYETEASEVEGPDTKNVTVYESQSQLAEDAIKEELLKEEMLNDNEENAKRYVLPRVEDSKDEKYSEGLVTVPESDTEDMLSVKPIGIEKKKNTILYTVNPSYKPLKKIDVQPPKQFVRDPDDNSWRNESISSLGIVFKPKNASKSFTQVLKNKTEIELANMTDRDNKDDVPDLRVRLEKIAEVRKSKKRINKFGDTVYSDYEESGERANLSLKEDTTTPSFEDSILDFTPPPIPKSLTTEIDLSINAISTDTFSLFKNDMKPPTTNKPKKFYNVAEYYDATDEYDADYVNQHKIDLKKFTKPLTTKETPVTPPPQVFQTKPMREYQPERKATLQYFPPTQKNTQKVNINDYDVDFNRKVNLYTMKAPLRTSPTSFATASPVATEKYLPVSKVTIRPTYTPMYQTEGLERNPYLTTQPRVTDSPNGFVPNDGNFNRASYVIKHYRDFINEAAKESEDERGEYQYTEPPLRGVTITELTKMTTSKDTNPGDDDYEYDVKFRKDIMNRFVDNFNQNSERFKVDFPILYNSSIVHRQTPENGRIASSTAFIKRLYEVNEPRASNFLSHRKPCDPHCDPNLTVELSPAYELHYYVPDQEEKEEMEQKPATVPYQYRL
uniref:SFRICE_014438 n=1 Tax=Spodoptera frugiperda TaxID=7108 RepID=A0A2H1WK30_SPOFR